MQTTQRAKFFKVSKLFSCHKTATQVPGWEVSLCEPMGAKNKLAFWLFTHARSKSFTERYVFDEMRYSLKEVQKYFPAQQILVFHYVNCNNVCVKTLELDLHPFYGCILQLYIITGWMNDESASVKWFLV